MNSADIHRPTAEELLACPRGRSLLGVATQVPDHLEAAFDEESEPRTQEAQKHAALCDSLFIAGFLADQANGLGAAMYLGGGSVEPEQGSVTAVDMAEKLRVVSPSAPSRKSVEAELSDVVGDAKYWQPPDGVEFIAADDEVRTALIQVD